MSSLFWLLEAWRDFAPADDATNIPESGNGTPDLLDEARNGLEWLLSVQGPMARSTTRPVRVGTRPTDGTHRMSDRRTRVGTWNDPDRRAVGILGSASQVYRAVDADFSARLLEAAGLGWRYLEARPDEHSDGASCAAYRQDGDPRAGRAARMSAAAGLLVATGAPRFDRAFERWLVEISTTSPASYRFSAYAGLLYRRAAAAAPDRRAAIDARLAVLSDRIAAAAASGPFAWTGRYVWGSGIGFERSACWSRCLADRGGAARRAGRRCRASTTPLAATRWGLRARRA
ncbi:MAG: glycoside hydrolase family 9 protein [Vicinamibacterales bacterium]